MSSFVLLKYCLAPVLKLGAPSSSFASSVDTQMLRDFRSESAILPENVSGTQKPLKAEDGCCYKAGFPKLFEQA